jgi:bifunctional DNA-binding transcriptional regulator/antitoxin component of YhaV-PrlF toxin-antitoxin module
MANNTNQPEGFSEDTSPFEFTPVPKTWRLNIGTDGRVVIPAAVRAKMDLGVKGDVTAHLENGELRIVSPKVALRRFQEYAKASGMATGHVVDDFIAERRAEAAREELE